MHVTSFFKQLKFSSISYAHRICVSNSFNFWWFWLQCTWRHLLTEHDVYFIFWSLQICLALNIKGCFNLTSDFEFNKK